MIMKMLSLNCIQQTLGDHSVIEWIAQVSSKICNWNDNLTRDKCTFLCTLLGANDQQIQVLLGLFNDAVVYRYKGLLPTDDVM
jgi:hypothetical protein